MIIGSCAPSPPETRTSVAMADTAPPLDDVTARRLQISAALLSSDADNIESDVRVSAARELLDLNRAEARAVLDEALRSGQIEPTRAVLDAMRLGSTTHAALIDTVIEIMPEFDPSLRETTGALLSRFSQRYPKVVVRVGAQALDQSQPAERRLAALVALGGFRHTPAPAAAELMTILDRANEEPPIIVTESMTQLSRLTGLPPNDNRELWLTWWRNNRNRPAELWLEDMVEALTRQVAETQQALNASRVSAARMSKRLLETYSGFWPLLPVERQQEGLPALLSDELPDVRAFGVERLAILLRDGHATTDGQLAALELLSDDRPEVRTRVAALLAEFDPTLVAEAIPRALVRETDAAVLNKLLLRTVNLEQLDIDATVLASRLEDPTTSEAAAAALWAMARRDQLNDAQRESIAPAVTQAWQTTRTPSMAALLLLAAPNSSDGVMSHLDDEDRAWKEPIAEAMLRSGRHEALLERADDEVIYPFALSATEQQPTGSTLARVLALTPPESQTRRWHESVQRAAEAVPLQDRLEADNLLNQHPSINETDRIALLQAAISSDTVPDSLRADMVGRAGPLVLRTGDPRVVVSMVDGLPESSVSPSLTDMKFEAALRGRLFDEAAGVYPEPVAWVAAFERLETTQPEAADLVRSEIVRRYGEALDGDLRKRLGLAADPMMGDADSDTPSTN